MYGLAYFHILKYSYTNCSRKISVHVLSTNNDQILNWRLHKNRCLYWVTAIMGFLFNTLYAALSIWNLIFRNKPAILPCLIDHNCSVLKYLQRWSPHFTSCNYNHFKCSFHRIVSSCEVWFQRSPRQGGQCFSCKQCLYSIHVLTLWNILIAVQLVTMIATPICMLLFIHHRVLILLGQPFLQAITDYVS